MHAPRRVGVEGGFDGSGKDCMRECFDATGQVAFKIHKFSCVFWQGFDGEEVVNEVWRGLDKS